MPRSPYGFIARFVSFTVASVACAAIASASAGQAYRPAPDGFRAFDGRHRITASDPAAANTVVAANLAGYPLDRTLIARADELGFATGPYAFDGVDRVRSQEAAITAPEAVAEKFGLHLPQPGRLMSIVATIGLIGFFFARRLG